MDEKEPQRYKLPSEYTDDDRAAVQRFGGSGLRPERDEYVSWREQTLAEEHDDLALRGRLLGESAEVLRAQARDKQTDAQAEMSVEDHAEHLAAIQSATGEGRRPAATRGRRGSGPGTPGRRAGGPGARDHRHLAQEAAA